MDVPPHPELLPSDVAVLKNLLRDIEVDPESSTHQKSTKSQPTSYASHDDTSTLSKLDELSREPTVFTTRDYHQLNLSTGPFATILSRYITWASTIIRNPADVVFLTHIILYFSTSVPSALFLYHHYTPIHGVLHWIMQLSYCGSFTLMLHNHIHNNGLLQKRHAWFDLSWPYLLEPLMGHTWDSYFYHHVKHHHVEGNGPEDLSSTIRYQRDEASHFLMYLGRFMFCIWYELPMYFWRKGKYEYAFKAGVKELANYALIVALARWRFAPTFWVLILPLVQMRIGLMVGNFGQHALVDDVDPESDYRSSITLIDVASNRHCFNDGYHTSHHLNPLRHWRDHPRAFIKGKHAYASNDALVFRNIDYLMMTYRLLRKDYAYLADCLVPIGEQKKMTKGEIADMLRKKTRAFSEEEIRAKFYEKKNT